MYRGTCIIERFVRYGRWVTWGVLLCLAVILSVLALPWWGANVGGAVTAFAAFGYWDSCNHVFNYLKHIAVIAATLSLL